MINYRNQLLCAVDTETTGLDSELDEVIQICILPLEPIDLEPDPKYQPFYQLIKPNNVENISTEAEKVHGISRDVLMMCPSQEEVAESLLQWFYSLKLNEGSRLIPLCQNSPFDVAFIKSWLGVDMYDRIFSRRGRDTQYLAAAINDEFEMKGLAAPFPKLSLASLTNHFSINLDGHHDAMADCLATAKLYRELLLMEKP